MNMEIEERKLEELSLKIENYADTKPTPMFEMYITLFSITVAIVLFLYEDMMLSETVGSGAGLNGGLLGIMSQNLWAITFFTAGLLKAVGLVLEIDWLRTLGLIISGVLYLIISVLLFSSFPNFGSIIFFYTTVFTIYSIGSVRYTGIRNHIGKGGKS